MQIAGLDNRNKLFGLEDHIVVVTGMNTMAVDKTHLRSFPNIIFEYGKTLRINHQQLIVPPHQTYNLENFIALANENFARPVIWIGCGVGASEGLLYVANPTTLLSLLELQLRIYRSAIDDRVNRKDDNFALWRR